MRRRWVWILLVVLALVFMAAAGPGAQSIDALVHSDSFRHEIEKRASTSANGKVEIKEIAFSVWSGVQLRGVALKTQTPQGVVTAKIESINCAYSLLALLRRQVELTRVTVENPEIVLTQQPASSVATPSTGAKPATKPPEPEKLPPLQIVLESAKISRGQLTIRDASGTSKADLQGVRVYADTSGFYNGGDVISKMSIDKIALPQNLNLTDFTTPFKYHTGAMEADPFEAHAFGGKIDGHYHLDPGSPSTLDVTASDIDVQQVTQSANPKSPTMLKGSLSLQSSFHGVETGTLIGEGDAQIVHGKLQGVDMLNRLAGVLHVRGLADPDLTTVKTHFEVAGGTTEFSHLDIESSDFSLTGDGTISPDGRLNANLTLSLHGSAMGGISGAAAALFSRIPGGGGSIPIHITGTVSNPQTNLSPALFNAVPKAEKVEKAINKISHLF